MKMNVKVYKKSVDVEQNHLEKTKSVLEKVVLQLY